MYPYNLLMIHDQQQDKPKQTIKIIRIHLETTMVRKTTVSERTIGTKILFFFIKRGKKYVFDIFYRTENIIPFLSVSAHRPLHVSQVL